MDEVTVSLLEDAAALVTVMVYVVVPPLCAVTITGIAFEPTLSEMEPEGEPEVTGVPLTVTVALAWLTVGVMVRAETPLATLSV